MHGSELLTITAGVQVDAEKHVTAVEMAGPPKGGDQLAQGTELLAHVEQDMAHSMPDDRPPWQVHFPPSFLPLVARHSNPIHNHISLPPRK
jgi:hypothetical protein